MDFVVVAGFIQSANGHDEGYESRHWARGCSLQNKVYGF